MKHIKTFEKFSLPLFRKKVEEPVEDKSNVVEIPVDWTGSYEYNGKNYMLEIGDYTNRGIIKKIVEDIVVMYVTDEGAFFSQELTVFKGDEGEIKTFIDSKKYNL